MVPSCLCLLPAPPWLPCPVHELPGAPKVCCSLSRWPVAVVLSRWFCGLAAEAREGGCVLPFFSPVLSVCFGGTSPIPLSPCLVFSSSLGLMCESTARAGQLSRVWARGHTTLLELGKGLNIMGKFSRHLQDMVAVATGLLIW